MGNALYYKKCYKAEIRFKVNKGWSTAVLLFFYPYMNRYQTNGPMEKNNKVLLGMSGGTDSSVAAMLLQDAGYEVTGITQE